MPNRRLLVVDDEKNIVEAYAEFLAPTPAAPARRSSRGAPPPAPGSTAPATAAPAEAGYEILKAYSGDEAVAVVQAELAAGRRIAGGFFDVKMEGGKIADGLQAIREIWKLDPDMNCTVVTAFQDRTVGDIDQLFGARFADQWDYLNKPFTQAEIVQKARQMTAAWQRRADLADAQAKLVASERMAVVGQLARSIGHEFGNLLQAIMGKADLAITDQDPARVKQKLEHILQASEKASLIVKNLQGFSKGSSSRAAVDPSKLVRDALSLMGHEMKKNTVTVQEAFQPTAPVLANAGEIEQVLLNLLINATHAMAPKGGTITVGIREEGSEVLLSVADTGTGIPADVLPRIFDYAFTTKGDKGSGLGLAISKEIVTAHGGRIEVATQPGQGTTFTLRLPKGAA